MAKTKRAQQEPVLVASGITKSFFGNVVLDQVGIELVPGQVHGLVGENGAGKSTLMKILAGVYQRDGGEILLNGSSIDYTHPVQATADGIVTVFQEFNLLPERTVAENVYLGREPRQRGLVSKHEMERRTAELLESIGIASITPSMRLGSLTVAEQQIVEIVKALSFEARIISMDEPTAALADHEVELLYGIIERLKQRGVAILYVSHRLKEIFELCDRITVLKDGVQVFTGAADSLDTAELVRLMVGRSISSYFPPHLPGTSLGASRLSVHDAGNDFIDGISFDAYGGEILGIAGLQGSGRTELAEALFGAQPFLRGTVLLDGKPHRIRSPRAAVKSGIALITEDRKRQGLALNQSILNNLLMVVHSVFPKLARSARTQLPGILSGLQVNTDRVAMEVQYLSGGNQQKIVIGKWLSVEPRVITSPSKHRREHEWTQGRPRIMILDEPTRGIDVGAKIAVYELIRRLAHEGVAVVMISSELPELISMADRILVMHDGRLSAELPAASTEEQVLAAATGAIQIPAGQADPAGAELTDGGQTR